MLTKMPSPLEWFSFTFASGNLLAGPYFELSDYLNYMERKGPWDPKSRRPTARSQYRAGVGDLRFVLYTSNITKPSFCMSAYPVEAPGLYRPTACCHTRQHATGSPYISLQTGIACYSLCELLAFESAQLQLAEHICVHSCCRR